MSTPEPSALDIRGQTRRSLRTVHVRETNTFDEGVVLHSLYTGQNVPSATTIARPAVSAGTAEWSAPLNIRGYDQITLFIDHTIGSANANTSLYLDIECSWHPKGPWYQKATGFDLFTGDATEVALSDRLFITTTGMTLSSRIYYATEFQAVGNYLRIFPWVHGPDGTGTRLKLDVCRVMGSS